MAPLTPSSTNLPPRCENMRPEPLKLGVRRLERTISERTSSRRAAAKHMNITQNVGVYGNGTPASIPSPTPSSSSRSSIPRSSPLPPKSRLRIPQEHVPVLQPRTNNISREPLKVRKTRQRRPSDASTPKPAQTPKHVRQKIAKENVPPVATDSEPTPRQQRLKELPPIPSDVTFSISQHDFDNVDDVFSKSMVIEGSNQEGPCTSNRAPPRYGSLLDGRKPPRDYSGKRTVISKMLGSLQGKSRPFPTLRNGQSEGSIIRRFSGKSKSSAEYRSKSLELPKCSSQASDTSALDCNLRYCLISRI
jgi:hypothetical protein